MRDFVDEVLRENVAAMTVALLDIRQKMDDLLQRMDANVPTPAPSDAAQQSARDAHVLDALANELSLCHACQPEYEAVLSRAHEAYDALTAARGRGES